MVKPALLLVAALLGGLAAFTGHRAVEAAGSAELLPPSTHATLLTDAQWENTVRDLLRLPATPGLSNAFPATPAASGTDFGRNAPSLMVGTTSRWEAYRHAAETLARRVTGDPLMLDKILPARARQGDVATRVRLFVADFLPRAYRRPVTAEEINAMVALAERAASLNPSSDPFQTRVRWILTAVLQTPFFLYRIEGGIPGAEGGRVRLTENEVAAKLSYALWNTMPDERLARYARSGTLATRHGVAAVVTEMLGDWRATPVLMDFHEQLFEVDKFDGIVRQTGLFPNFYPDIGRDAQQDVRRTIWDLVVDKPGTVKDLYSSNVAYVNASLAKVYGIDTAQMPELQADPKTFVRVRMPDSRAGIPMHVGWLAMKADETDPSPIQRGVSVARRALCLPLGSPPPGALATRIEGPPGATNRQRVEATTERTQACSGCHGRVINPMGFAFEAFDAIGAFRQKDGASAIDTTGTTSVLGAFDGASTMLRAVANTRNAHTCYAAHWSAYLNGTPALQPTAEWLAPIVDRSMKGAPVREIVAGIAQSDAFLSVSH